ncbi:MAG: hypothetical protein IM537_18790 [Pseudanabaena sp. M57BS1SP1A06MG]|nr:hypothetical protein [Pseudanabaena sp. M34BS1SP1A06MG]MCA6602197.1 hypothetical protein [Pseudanabaena sp. M57BS1SP1A06MG]
MSNPILIGGCLWTEGYRGWTLEAYKTSLGGAIQVIRYRPRVEFIIYAENCIEAMTEARNRIDQELEDTFDELPF